MKQDFITFERFDNEYDTKQMAVLLKQNNIVFEIEDTSPLSDVIFGAKGIDKSYSIKLKKEDFERAHLLVEENATTNTEHVDPDYYLLSFSDAELKDVIVTRDEWSPYDVVLAKRLLKERSIELSDSDIKAMKAERLTALSKPEKDQSAYIIAGYIMASLGGLLGLFIGWHLQSHKKTLPNGDMVYAYSAENRRSGKRIVFIGIIAFIGWTVYFTFFKWI